MKQTINCAFKKQSVRRSVLKDTTLPQNMPQDLKCQRLSDCAPIVLSIRHFSGRRCTRQIIAAKNQCASLSQSASVSCAAAEWVRENPLNVEIIEPQMAEIRSGKASGGWLLYKRVGITRKVRVLFSSRALRGVCVHCIWHNLVRGYRVHNEGASGVSRYDGIDDTKSSSQRPYGQKAPADLEPWHDYSSNLLHRGTAVQPVSQRAGGKQLHTTRFAHTSHALLSLFLSTVCAHAFLLSGCNLFLHVNRLLIKVNYCQPEYLEKQPCFLIGSC